MRLTCAIIDDEPLAVSLLESYVLKTPFLDLQGTYNSALDALSDLRDRPVDLLFLDICMKKLNGMETARKLRQIQCKVPIIFLTASPDYAIESYEVQASGYLLKSFSEEKLMKLLNRILKTDMKRRVAIKNRRQYRYPCTDDIMYIDLSLIHI